MTGAPEEVARVGLAAWVGESRDPWDTSAVLGVLGEDLYLVEIDRGNRARLLFELVERCFVDDGSLRIELVFFGSAGGFFASSMHFLEHWPRAAVDVPAEVAVDERYRAAFTNEGGEVVVSVRHALRPDAPPRRRFRFRSDKYDEAMVDLARETRRLREDLMALAHERAPEKVESLARTFDPLAIPLTAPVAAWAAAGRPGIRTRR